MYCWCGRLLKTATKEQVRNGDPIYCNATCSTLPPLSNTPNAGRTWKWAKK